jgi:hypothetical protein
LESSPAPSPAKSKTPLLDAAIQRVEAVTRMERETASFPDWPDAPGHKPKPAPKLPAAMTSRPAKTAESNSSHGRAESPARSDDRLSVANLQLCRKVAGFGSFEPWGPPTVKPGQRVLLYCEMTGLRYEAAESGFVSRLSTRVELRRADTGKLIWEEELGIAKDACSRVRHDYYVSYRLKLPESLPAGKHRLRIAQTDLAANRSASSEVELTVAQ